MNARPAIAAFAIFGSLLAGAQNVTEEPRVDPVLDAIQDFNNRDRSKPNEVSVVLDAPEETPARATPVLVTGKPQEEADPVKAPEPTPQETVPTAPVQAAPQPEDGLAVRVEKVHASKGNIDPSQVKLLAPFPAKPLAQPPAGWRLDASDSAPPFTREVEIAPGSKITLTIRPHLLVPDADGASVFTVAEPGYDTALGYQQAATVGAILSNSTRQLDEDSKQLGTAIDSLQQLLISLPKPEAPPVAIPEAKPATLRKR